MKVSSAQTPCAEMQRRSRPASRRGSPRTSWSNYGTFACCWSGTSAATRKGADKMAFITRLSLRLGVVVLLGVALLFGAGIFAATQVQQDLLPDISVPAVLVITPYPRASPEFAG